MLPKVVTPKTTLKLPSNGKEIKLRPYTVGEEETIIIARESQNSDQITDAVLDTLEACIVSEGVNVRTLPFYDVEYLMVMLRSISVSEVVAVKITDEIDGKEVETPVQFRLPEVQVKHHDDFKTDIEFAQGNNGPLFVKLRVPEFKLVEQARQYRIDINEKRTPSNNMSPSKFIRSVIEQIYDKEDIYDLSEVSDEEFDAWWNSLSKPSKTEIEKFFDTLPILYLDVSYKPRGTKEVKTERIEGFLNFFALA